MEPEKAKECIKIITDYFGDKAQIVSLSLTGSRAFGWSSNHDYDVHGFFVSDKYWDHVHDGVKGYDINLWEFRHCIMDIDHQHFEVFQNFCDPFYRHPKFDYEGWMSFCLLDGVQQKWADMQSQINRFKLDKASRTGLHAYRIMMVPLHFIYTGKIVRNVFELNKLYPNWNFPELENLRMNYAEHKGTFNYEQAIKDLDGLYSEYKTKIDTMTITKPDMDKAWEWYKSARKKLLEVT